MTLYSMHGLVIDSTIALHHARSTVGPPDIVIRLGDARPVPDERGPGELIAHLDAPDGRHLFAITREPERFLLRFFGTADVVVDSRLNHVTVHSAPEVDPEILAVLIPGITLATVLQLRGHLVLHSGAVEVNGRVVALVGPSGIGKSTISAMLCTVGARLVTDDVLRVDLMPRLIAHPGATESRLRTTAQQLLPAESLTNGRVTGDQRLAVQPALLAERPLPLARIALPRPRPDITAPCVRRLAPAEAARLLLISPRVVGWVDPDTTMRYFAGVSQLAERVPAVVLEVPWGRPFTRSGALELLNALFAVDELSPA